MQPLAYLCSATIYTDIALHAFTRRCCGAIDGNLLAAGPTANLALALV